MNASCMKKTRKKRYENTIQISRSGTYGNERIHISRAVFGLFVGSYKKLFSENEQHRRGQKPHNPIGIRHIHKEHPDNKKRNGKNHGSDYSFFEFVITVFFDFL